jgi:hypothetical protein
MATKAVFNPVLTGFAVQNFKQLGSVFVAARLAPIFTAALSSAQYPVFDIKDSVALPRLEVRKPGSAYKRISVGLSKDSYSTQDRGIEGTVDDNTRKIYKLQIDIQKATVAKTQLTIMHDWDWRVKEMIDAARAASTITVASTPTTKWGASGSTPIKAIKAAKNAFFLRTGQNPNTITLPRAVAEALEENSDILSRITYTGRTQPIAVNIEDGTFASVLSQVLGIPNVIIAGGIYNSANEGQDINLDYIWGKDVILSCSQPSNDLTVPNLARTFVFDGVTPEDQTSVFEYRDENVKSDIYRISHFTDEKITGAILGTVIPDVIS